MCVASTDYLLFRVYVPSILVMCLLMPIVVPWYFWGESLANAFFICAILRFTVTLNFTWCVNSVAHMWGNKPYDRHISPIENAFVAFGAIGEGFHNFHHTFPTDYSTSELGWKLNLTTFFIDMMAKIGQAYDLKSTPRKIVMARKLRTGDGTEGFGYGPVMQK